MGGANRTIGSLARFLPCGDTALTVEFGSKIDPVINDRTSACAQAVAAMDCRGVTDIVPTFRSFTVHYDPRVVSHQEIVARIAPLEVPGSSASAAGKTWRVPVLYGGEGGPDMERIAELAGMDVEEAAILHASPLYRVYMLGFLPGFAYLGDLPEPLRQPRLATPRAVVSAGSLAIAESLTAVYPAASPGGWHLIGRTPLRLFDCAAARPSLFAQGDAVRFVPVTPARYGELEDEVKSGSYIPCAAS